MVPFDAAVTTWLLLESSFDVARSLFGTRVQHLWILCYAFIKIVSLNIFSNIKN